MMPLLLSFGAAELVVSLALAWLGVLALHMGLAPLARVFPRPHYIIKAHIDYLLMALLLFAFYLIALPLPDWVVGCMLLGSATNPLLFLALAMRNTSHMPATSPLAVASVASFVVTTAGFGGAAVMILLH